MKIRQSVVYLLSLLLLACSQKLNPSLLNTGGEIFLEKAVTHAEFHFLNVGSFVLKVGESVVLNDPFLSNRSLGKLMFTKLYSDTLLIDSILQNSFVQNASFTFIGHGHYDHLMDIQAFEKHITHPNHKILASETVKNMLAGVALKSTVVEVEKNAASKQNSNPAWIYNDEGSIRVMGLHSWHPPHFLGKVMYSKPLSKPRKSPPSRLKHYKLGQPLMYLIDFIEDEKIVFRAFVQTSSEKHFHNHIPKTIWDEKNVDIAVVGIAMNRKRIGYANELINSVNPNAVFLCHWENFFKPYGYNDKGVKKSDIEFNYYSIQKNLPTGTILIMPKHNTKFHFLKTK